MSRSVKPSALYKRTKWGGRRVSFWISRSAGCKRRNTYSGVVKSLAVTVQVASTFEQDVLAAQQPSDRVDLVGDIEGVVSPVVYIRLNSDAAVQLDVCVYQASGVEFGCQGQILIFRDDDGSAFLTSQRSRIQVASP